MRNIVIIMLANNSIVKGDIINRDRNRKVIVTLKDNSRIEGGLRNVELVEK